MNVTAAICLPGMPTAHRPPSVLAGVLFAVMHSIRRWIAPLPESRSHRESTRQSDDSPPRVLVLDASGSMQLNDWPPTRLEAAKEAAETYCRRLADEEPSTPISIIAYGNSAMVYAKRIPARKTKELTAGIQRIGELGWTNIRAGLEIAQRILSDRTPGAQIVLLSDGHNTERDPLPIATELKKFATIETIGIGASPECVDTELMKAAASAYPDGTKRYRWIGDKEQLVREFHELAGRITRS